VSFARPALAPVLALPEQANANAAHDSNQKSLLDVAREMTSSETTVHGRRVAATLRVPRFRECSDSYALAAGILD